MKKQNTEFRNVLNFIWNGFNFINPSDKNNFFFRMKILVSKEKLTVKKTVLFILKNQKSSDTHIEFFFFFFMFHYS